MEAVFKAREWYTHDNGKFSTTFFCVAVDGEYLFPTKNINGKGYSSLLCRKATQIEIYRAKELLKKKK